ncbi:spore germination protein GerPC [Paenibacillus sp. OV219]|uniref:spore germination protein GerPC n=1 Tax=Paenibacillus sp. OV219 TaxID=1884377 RepID=UPI0008C0AE43|nr:spore germination protein GerPC [Paenibacillus sp. OV219]SEM74501.1 spore germination protein PC [Paenibacillus sp. OV219]
MQPSDQQPLTPWQMWNLLSHNMHKLHCQLNEQQAVINKLNKQIEMLNVRIEMAENKPMYHVDTIQYHFDQLKVEKLDGTLNIGMTPPSEEFVKEVGQLVLPSSSNVSEVVVNDPSLLGKTPKLTPANSAQNSKVNHFPAQGGMVGGPQDVMPSAPFPEVRRQVDLFLDHTAPERLKAIETEMAIPLDPYHRRLVIEDIRKQMSTRIQFYIEQVSKSHNGAQTQADGQSGPGTGEIDKPSIPQTVISKTTRDIEMALRNYMSKLQNNGS